MLFLPENIWSKKKFKTGMTFAHMMLLTEERVLKRRFLKRKSNENLNQTLK